ncbi:hypothetical protein [Lebetimonas sp. JH292]|uniref:hypothetical protein n=1 Tax=Lebetimonas sp. JH292 TaxID=990068 RepID=UPI0004671B3D|nr:hypothetical protein [Lebetimonas sp. JH292]
MKLGVCVGLSLQILSWMQMIHLTNVTFNKDEFIFGLFLGNELYNNVKSNKREFLFLDCIPNGDPFTGEQYLM